MGAAVEHACGRSDTAGRRVVYYHAVVLHLVRKLLLSREQSIAASIGEKTSRIHLRIGQNLCGLPIPSIKVFLPEYTLSNVCFGNVYAEHFLRSPVTQLGVLQYDTNLELNYI